MKIVFAGDRFIDKLAWSLDGCIAAKRHYAFRGIFLQSQGIASSTLSSQPQEAKHSLM